MASKVPRLEDSLVQINDHLLAIAVVQAFYEGRNAPESMLQDTGLHGLTAHLDDNRSRTLPLKTLQDFKTDYTDSNDVYRS